MSRVYLSVPHMGGREEAYVREDFATNWLSTVGPNLDAFEAALEARLGRPAVALVSGTAALHLALRAAGVGPGDEVLVSDLTFVASVNPVLYLGARPAFVDSDPETWTMSPALLRRALEARARAGQRPPKAAVVVHLYGQCADMDPIAEACRAHGVVVVEDAAEGLGAHYKGRPAGALGDVSILSFNGNKIVTTTGGGALLSPHRDWVERARGWSQQARAPRAEYHHEELGYNYRLSNVLAGIGRGQLEVLDERVAQRRAVFARYAEAFRDLDGLEPMPEAPYGLHTRWLSCFTVDAGRLGATRDDLIDALARVDVEARPVWKPMHLQPLHANWPREGGEVGARLYRDGICLPSSSSLSAGEQRLVVETVRAATARRR